MNQLTTAYNRNGLSLKNHIAMAPMTRSRATDNIPNDLMETYYAQRNGAGLIITEGTAPTPDALGYPRIPGIFNATQIAGWKKVTAAVHAGRSKIFIQFMHTGRIGHQYNLPAGATLVGASDIKAAGQIYTDVAGMQDHSTPVALTTEDIQTLIADHITAARNAIDARFDGIELHGANGYLIEQFLHPVINNRTDAYGGSIGARAALGVELAAKIAAAIGKEKVGFRISPYSTLGDLAAYDAEEVHATYSYLAQELSKIGIAYLHISMNTELQQKTLQSIRENFKGTLILCNGFTPASAEEALQEGIADLIAFGRPFLANPDLVQRIATNATLNTPDFTTAFTPGAKGYTDYPTLA